MADFTITASHYTVTVNDGHSSATYEIDASTPEEAKLIAADNWKNRIGRDPPVPAKVIAPDIRPAADARRAELLAKANRSAAENVELASLNAP